MEAKPPYTTDFFSLLEVSGKDASVFLNNLITIDPSTLALHNGSKTLILNPRGEILFVLWIFRTKKSFLLLLPRPASPALTTFLNERIFLEEVNIVSLADDGRMHYYEYPPHNTLGSNDASIEGSEANKLYMIPISQTELKDTATINRGWRFGLRLSGNHDCLEYIPQTNEQDAVKTTHPEIISNQKLSAIMLQGGNGLYLLHSIITEQEHDIAKPIISAIAIPNLGEYINYNKGCYPGQEIITRAYVRQQTAVHWLVEIIPSNKPAHELLQNRIKSDAELAFINVKEQNIKLLTAQKTLGTLVAIARLLPLDTTSPTNVALALIHRDYASHGNTIAVIDSAGNQGNFRVVHGGIKEPSTDDDTEIPSFDSMMELGLKAYHQKNETNFSTAEKYFQTALTLNPSHPDPWEALAVIKEKQGKHDEAIHLNEEFAKRSSDSPLPHTNLSRLYMLKGQIERAEEEKQKATVLMFRQAAQAKKNLSPENTSLPEKLTSFQDELNKARTRKKAMFREVLKLDPADEIANFGLGKILFEEQSYQEAIPHLEETIHTNPNLSLAYAFLGKALLKTGAHDSARDVLTRGIACAKKQGEMLPLKEMEAAMGGQTT